MADVVPVDAGNWTEDRHLKEAEELLALGMDGKGATFQKSGQDPVQIHSTPSWH